MRYIFTITTLGFFFKAFSAIAGEIKKDTIEGWGFPRYVVGEIGPMAGTRMAIDPNAPKENRFIRLGGEPYLIRYNSRLPIVIYVPEGVEVRYRIWGGGSEIKMIEEGTFAYPFFWSPFVLIGD